MKQINVSRFRSGSAGSPRMKHGERQFDSFCWRLRDHYEKHHEFMMIMMRLWCRCQMSAVYSEETDKSAIWRTILCNTIQVNLESCIQWTDEFLSCGICLKQLTLNSRFTSHILVRHEQQTPNHMTANGLTYMMLVDGERSAINDYTYTFSHANWKIHRHWRRKTSHTRNQTIIETWFDHLITSKKHLMS